MGNNTKRKLDPMSNSQNMGKDGYRNIRDMAAGRCDFYNTCHIFRNPEYVLATISEVESVMQEAITIRDAIYYTYGGNKQMTTLQVNIYHGYNQRVTACQMVLNVLRDLYKSQYQSWNNGQCDTNLLKALLNWLPAYRNAFRPNFY